MYKADIEEMTEKILGEFLYHFPLAYPIRKRIEDKLTAFWDNHAVHIWGIDDVIESAMEHELAVTDNMARTILKNLETSVDSEYGIRWRDLADEIEDLFKEDFNLKKMEYLGKPLTFTELSELRGHFMFTHIPYGGHEYHYDLQKEGSRLDVVLKKIISMREEKPDDLYRVHILQSAYFQDLPESQAEMEKLLIEYGAFLFYVTPSVYNSQIEFPERRETWIDFIKT